MTTGLQGVKKRERGGEMRERERERERVREREREREKEIFLSKGSKTHHGLYIALSCL